MDSELTYKLAVSLTPGINAEVVRKMEDLGISPEEFVDLPMSRLSERFGTTVRFQDMHRQEALFRARKEEEFLARHSIKTFYLTDEDYPFLLREAHDAPVLLYMLGEADLNSPHIMNVVGTRKCSTYGMTFCGKLISDLAAYFSDLTVVSGLAHGIDAAAHEAALQNNICTIAVVAHGLDTIYPAANRDLARRIVKNGGAILSEYPSSTRVYRNNFLQRNRIVAGLCELTFVVESEVKGGAMSTANQAFSYNREIVALPGRWNDMSSSGCNYLIGKEKARIFTGIADLLRLMQWNPIENSSLLVQKPLFPELEGDQAIIYRFLSQKSSPSQIDEIHLGTALPVPVILSALTELEFDGVVNRLPGARYECC